MGGERSKVETRGEVFCEGLLEETAGDLATQDGVVVIKASFIDRI